jgi:Eukaryotic mitochondrial regulator protein
MRVAFHSLLARGVRHPRRLPKQLFLRSGALYRSFSDIRDHGSKDMDTGSGAPEPPFQVVFGEDEFEERRTPIPMPLRQKGLKKTQPVNTDDDIQDVDEPLPDELYIDSYLDPSEYSVSIVTEATKTEIWKLHKEDPTMWTYKVLAHKYRMKSDRMKAILHLMRLREDAIERIRPAVQADAENWDELYRKHSQDPEKNTAESLSAETGLSIDHVNDILTRMADYVQRMMNLSVSVEYTEGILNSLKRCGVDASFKESINKEGKLADDYYPELFGDDDFDARKEALRQKIILDTKAKAKVEFPSFVRSHEKRKELAAAIEKLPPPPVREGFMYKSKIAYRDLSLESKHSVIRTRTGRYQYFPLNNTLGTSNFYLVFNFAFIHVCVE